MNYTKLCLSCKVIIKVSKLTEIYDLLYTQLVRVEMSILPV